MYCSSLYLKLCLLALFKVLPTCLAQLLLTRVQHCSVLVSKHSDVDLGMSASIVHVTCLHLHLPLALCKNKAVIMSTSSSLTIIASRYFMIHTDTTQLSSISTHSSIYLSIYLHIYIIVCVCVLCIHVHTYIYIHIHTHTHTHTSIHLRVLVPSFPADLSSLSFSLTSEKGYRIINGISC